MRLLMPPSAARARVPHRPCRSVVWNEQNLAHCEANKDAQMKIDEPETPWASPPRELFNDDEGACARACGAARSSATHFAGGVLNPCFGLRHGTDAPAGGAGAAVDLHHVAAQLAAAAAAHSARDGEDDAADKQEASAQEAQDQV
jgi:hypothetical protein